MALDQEPRRLGLLGFAVRQDGAFAVAQEDLSTEREKIVAVYDADGAFSYAVAFSAPGSYGVDFDGDALRLWFVRGDCAVTVTPDGQVVRVQNAQDFAAIDAFWNEVLNATEQKVGDQIYKCRNRGWFARLFAGDYGELVMTQNGTVRILYQAEFRPLFTYASVLAILLPPAIAVLIVVLLKRKRNWRHEHAKDITRRSPDVEVHFAFNGARTHPAADGYHPMHLIDDHSLTTGLHHYYGLDAVPPDGSADGTITFIAPEAYPHCLWVGKQIPIQEGERVVGHAVVTRIMNPLLDASSPERGNLSG